MLAQTVELRNSDTVVEIDFSGVKMRDLAPGDQPIRQLIELEDAIVLARAILQFWEGDADARTGAEPAHD